MKALRRTIHPVIRVLDPKAGIAEYVASDETLDSYREVIRADGWRFDFFARNSPFVDSHEYGTIDRLLGKVTDYKVEGRKLVETVQWAIDVQDHRLAQLGWKLTTNGFLKAVSVGFRPVAKVSRFDSSPVAFQQQIAELGLTSEALNVRTIYTEQQQLELSAVILGANPNALAKTLAHAHKDGLVTDADVEFVSKASATAEHPDALDAINEDLERSETENADSTIDPALVEWAEARAVEQFLQRFEAATKAL